MVYERIFNPQKKALLGIRQFVCHNLKEKLHRIPKLSMMEKKWLVFQLLCAVSQIHSEKFVHGDIKPSNILLTSYNWLFVADLVPYKPSLLGEDDLKSYNLYFGELDNNQRCYIAPERFVAGPLDEQFDKKFLDPAMDIFSAGCCIAEIFMDGHPLFDLASLQNFRKKLYDPREDLNKRIKDHKIVDLIMSMIHRDHRKRAPINEYIIRWNKEIFPKSFHQVYFQLASTYVRPHFMFSDMKVSLIRKYINSIWYSCFGKKDASFENEFNEPIEPFVFERIRDDTIKDFEAYLVPSNELFIFLSKQNLQEMYKLPEESQKVNQEDKDSIIVAVHLIGTLITSCFYPQSRICGLEMLYKMARESSIDIRLQYILPYVLQMFDDENSKVKAKGIEVAVLMFEDVLDQPYLTTLSATDYKVFDNYILPAFLRLRSESSKDQYVQHVFVRYLPMLAQIGHRFLELSIGSKFQKRQMSKNTNRMSSTDRSSDSVDFSSQSNQIIEETKESTKMSGNIHFEDSDEDHERIFQQTDNLLASTVAHHHHTQHRGTVVIKDEKHQQEKHSHRHQQDAQEVFVNYDNEYDKLRRLILSIINDILAEAEPTLQRILYEKFGELSVFFGRKMTIDNLIPLSNSGFNKKDFMLRIECLKGIPQLGLRVGQQTLAKFLLITCTFNDSEEAVVNEMINTLNKLLEFGLLTKRDSLENLEKLLPFLLHPNTWIREGAMKFIKNLSDPKYKILSQAESYCIIRPKLKLYLNKGEKVYHIYDDLNLSKLRPALSRQVFEYEIKGIQSLTQIPNMTQQQRQQQIAQYEQSLTEQDKYAKLMLKEVLLYAKQYYQPLKRERLQKDIENDYNEEFRRKLEKTKTYRIVITTVVSQIGGLTYGNVITGIQQNYIQQKKKSSNESNDNTAYQKQIVQEDNEIEMLANDFKESMNSQEYLEQHFYSVINTQKQDIDRDNYGLNKRLLNNSSGMLNFENDFILQAMNIVPEDPELPLVYYKNPSLYQQIQTQSIQIGSQLTIEQPSQQPQQTPQFSENAKNMSISVNQTSQIFYQLGQQKSRFANWRPSGRLITTLYEHKNAVNALAITDDSQYFFTGSKLDNMVNIWKTKDIESDVTSHSAFSIKCKRQINCITTIDNSNYFALAGSQGCIDIYQMGRVDQENHKSSFQQERRFNTQSNMNNNNRYNQQQYQQSSAQTTSFANINNQEPNHTSIIKTIERREEGDITLCTNMILPIQQQHVLSYVTQRGSLYFHDMRSRFDVSSQQDLFGCQRGMATCMTIGQDPYQLYFGTIGGYVMIYDTRYNVVSSYEKHYSRSPINSIAAFSPSQSAYKFNRSDHNSPMMLISAGSNNYEVSLLNLDTSDVEILLTVDDKKNKENIVQTLPQIPSYYKETSSFYNDQQELPNSQQLTKRYENNNSLFRRYLQSNRNSQHFFSLVSLQQSNLIRNLDEEWLKNSKNRYMMVKTGYESGNACRKILVQRKYNSMLHCPDTVSYAITGGNDRKLRYWDFNGLKSKSYQVNTPNDDECQYTSEFAGDVLVVQEKVHQFKQFPQINSQIAARQIDNLNQSSNNYVPYQNSTYYNILGGLISGNETFGSNNEMNNGQGGRTQSFQTDRINDQDVVCNFNGLSEWQQFNGISLNQGCGVVGGTELSGRGGLDYMYRDSQNISHSDCILDLGVIELSSQEPILVSCGRDGLVKLWR
eukprot:403376447